MIDPGEQCDDGANNGTAERQVRRPLPAQVRQRRQGPRRAVRQRRATTAATARATRTARCAGYCGDGIKNGPEQCDNGAANVPIVDGLRAGHLHDGVHVRAVLRRRPRRRRSSASSATDSRTAPPPASSRWRTDALTIAGWPPPRRGLMRPLCMLWTAALAAGGVVTLASAVALAQNNVQSGEFSAQTFQPAPGTKNFLSVEGVRMDGKWGFSVGVVGNYGRNPFVIESCRSSTDCSASSAADKTSTAVVSDMFTADLLAAVSPLQRLQLGLRLPLSYVNGAGLDVATGQGIAGGIHKFGVGDPQIEGKVRLLGGADDPVPARRRARPELPGRPRVQHHRRDDQDHDGLLPRQLVAGDGRRARHLRRGQGAAPVRRQPARRLPRDRAARWEQGRPGRPQLRRRPRLPREPHLPRPRRGLRHHPVQRRGGHQHARGRRRRRGRAARLADRPPRRRRRRHPPRRRRARRPRLPRHRLRPRDQRPGRRRHRRRPRQVPDHPRGLRRLRGPRRLPRSRQRRRQESPTPSTGAPTSRRPSTATRTPTAAPTRPPTETTTASPTTPTSARRPAARTSSGTPPAPTTAAPTAITTASPTTSTSAPTSPSPPTISSTAPAAPTSATPTRTASPTTSTSAPPSPRPTTASRTQTAAPTRAPPPSRSPTPPSTSTTASTSPPSRTRSRAPRASRCSTPSPPS